MKIKTNFTQVRIEFEGSTFLFSPLKVRSLMDAESVMQELLKKGGLDQFGFHDLSRAAREQMFDTLNEHMVGWEGVTDERGRVVNFEPELINGLGPVQVVGLFFRLYSAAHVSEDERKNSSTPSNQQKPAAASIAPDVLPEVNTHAGGPERLPIAQAADR